MVLLTGLLLAGGLAVAVRAVAEPAVASDGSTNDQALVNKGRQLFLVGCASCHGRQGEGVVAKDGTEYGPPLVGVGAAAVDFQVGTGRMPLAMPGAQAEKKPPVFDPDEVRALAAYVASLAPGPAIPTKDEYSVEGLSNEAVVRGGEFFRTNCTACHNFAGSGGALPGGKHAPPLHGVTPKHMYEAMLTGPQQMPAFSDQVLTPHQKRDIIAYLKSLESAPNYGGFGMGAYGPVSEGMFAWIVGIGGLVSVAVWIAAHTARSKKGSKA